MSTGCCPGAPSRRSSWPCLQWAAAKPERSRAAPGRQAASNQAERSEAMKIVKIEDLHCDAGFRVNSFLKVTTDEGIVGWSEYMEGYGAVGLSGVIRKL